MITDGTTHMEKMLHAYDLTNGVLFTDFYQLTMAQVYFRLGLHERPAQFDHFFRRYPDYDNHQAGYCINAGLEWLITWMERSAFGDHEIEHLRSLRTATGAPMFAEDFLAWLRANGTFDGVSLRAVPEGRVVHPNMPLTMVQGPLAMAQVLETPLLNILNFQTLVATKAARIFESGLGRPMLEFGLRRAQGFGGNAGTRAALIGGADFSSNTGMSVAMGLPPKGTHAHSLVQLCMALGMGELGAFEAFAEIYPDDCVLLVDTIDTLESGVPNAIRVFERLKRKGHRPGGIRLDSGDQAFLAIQAAKLLDEAGFEETSIVLSSDLDELVIWQIITQIAQEAPRYGLDADKIIKRLVYGVGTRLITSWGEPALGGVYKLVAVKEDGDWASAIKISETPAKTPNPGVKRAWRLYDRRYKATADLLTVEEEEPRAADRLLLRHPTDHTKYRTLQSGDLTRIEELHVQVLDAGRCIYSFPDLEEIRRVRHADVEALDPGIRRLVNPHIYHVSLSGDLWDLKQRMIAQATGNLKKDL
jgi:nicotinate phosphoribosyltransferase